MVISLNKVAKFISDCEIIVKFSKPQFMGALGVIEQTYYEMGSAQSQPCSYKSSEVTDIEVVYAKKAYQLRKN